MERLTTIAKSLDGEPADTTSNELNELMQSHHEDKGRSKSTVRSVQYALRRFYRFHNDLGVHLDEISTYRQEGKGFDPDDILKKSELEEIEKAGKNPREKLIVNLLRYTGLRVTALITLRVKDVKTYEGDTGQYRLIREATGFKGGLITVVRGVRCWVRFVSNPPWG